MIKAQLINCTPSPAQSHPWEIKTDSREIFYGEQIPIIVQVYGNL